MPNNSHRVASKQAELRERKRRTPKHSSGIEASTPAAQQGTSARIETSRSTSPTETNSTYSHGKSTQEMPSLAINPFAHNPYIWPEIKRIGITTTLMMILLAVLTVILQ